MAGKQNMVETDGYAKSKLLPDDVSRWRQEAEEFIRSRKVGGKNTSSLDIEAQWSVTATDNKATGAIKYSPKDVENQVKREMAVVLNRVMDDSGKVNTKSQFYKELEQIEAGRGPSSMRMALALKHNNGNISYSEALTDSQERLLAARERGRTPAWDASKKVEQVVAKAEQAAAKALPAVVEFAEKNGGKAADFVEKHGGKLGKAAVGIGSVVAAGMAAASETNTPKQETFAEKSWRVAKAGLDDLLPGSKDLIEGRNMCKSAFSVASKGVAEVAGAGAGIVAGATVGGLTAAGTALVTGPIAPVAAPVAGAVAGWKAGDAAAESVSGGVQNVGKRLATMACGA